MEYIAERDHSEKELKDKLRRLKDPHDRTKPRFSAEEINNGIEWAHSNKWFKPSDQLAESVAQTLHNKKKGIRYINAYLAEKGLPPQPADDQHELEKAIQLIQRKILTKTIDSNLKLKLSRFLISRGFRADIVSKALKGVISEKSSS
jgi:regulatory protein